MANDPGYQRYDMDYPDEHDRVKIRNQHLYTSGTVGHNALLVDGEGQNSSEGKIDRFETTEGFDYLRGDATACYAPKLSRAHRYVALVKTPDAPAGGWFVLWDDLAAAPPTSPPKVAFLLHTDSTGVFLLDGRPAEEGKAVNVTEVAIEREKGRLTVHFLGAVEVTPHTYPNSEHYGHYVSITRPDADQMGFVALLWAGPKGSAARPEKAEVLGDAQGGKFSVEWSAGGKTYDVRFDRQTGRAKRER